MSFEAVVRAELGRRGVSETVMGELACLLAGRLDAGESAGPVSRELRATLATLGVGSVNNVDHELADLLAEVGDAGH
jgi:hypothetical protein